MARRIPRCTPTTTLRARSRCTATSGFFRRSVRTLRTRPTALGALAAAAFAAGCTSRLPLESGASTLVVTAVLNTMQDTQVVLVQRTTNGGPAAAPVDSAVVTITGPDGVEMIGVEAYDANLGRNYRVTLSAFHEH